jgi:phosphoribosyl-AMP cyclohydrolase / phosphoribosyl-ATP pyrophosphohydrolase
MTINASNLDFDKNAGLIPTIVQDAADGRVLMLGYMNAEALEQTLETQRVTFFSRSKQRLWTKGETSGNVLELVDIAADCDRDTLLVQAHPAGPACHTGTETCFGDTRWPAAGFLARLDSVVAARAGAESRIELYGPVAERGRQSLCPESGRGRRGNGTGGGGRGDRLTQ